MDTAISQLRSSGESSFRSPLILAAPLLLNLQETVASNSDVSCASMMPAGFSDFPGVNSVTLTCEKASSPPPPTGVLQRIKAS